MNRSGNAKEMRKRKLFNDAKQLAEDLSPDTEVGLVIFEKNHISYEVFSQGLDNFLLKLGNAKICSPSKPNNLSSNWKKEYNSLKGNQKLKVKNQTEERKPVLSLLQEEMEVSHDIISKFVNPRRKSAKHIEPSALKSKPKKSKKRAKSAKKGFYEAEERKVNFHKINNPEEESIYLKTDKSANFYSKTFTQKLNQNITSDLDVEKIVEMQEIQEAEFGNVYKTSPVKSQCYFDNQRQYYFYSTQKGTNMNLSMLIQMIYNEKFHTPLPNQLLDKLPKTFFRNTPSFQK